MANPLVSVVIAVFDSAPFVAKAVANVRAQSPLDQLQHASAVQIPAGLFPGALPPVFVKPLRGNEHSAGGGETMSTRANSKQRVANSRSWLTGFALLVLVGMFLQGMDSDAGAAPLVLEAEVLEGSDSLDVVGTRAGPVRYALIHHAHEQDQSTFSHWLRSHETASVTFSTKDGQPHPGVLSRLKHCFGRGLLIYADPVGLAEKDLVRLQLPMVETKP